MYIRCRLVVVARSLLGDEVEFLPEVFGEGAEAAVEVLAAGHGDTLHAVEHLLTRVGAEVEPRVLLQREADGEPTHRHEFAGAVAALPLLHVLQVLAYAAQSAEVLGLHGAAGVPVAGARLLQQLGGRLRMVRLQRLPDLGRREFVEVIERHGLVQHCLGFRLAAGFDIGNDEDGGDHEDEHEHECDTSAVAEQADEHGGEESDRGGEEPAADDGEHARDTIDGGFARPCAVGKGGTHGDDERNVGGGQRQFERSAHDDEQTGEDKVDRRADEVERRAVCHDGFVFVEAAVYPSAHLLRQDDLQGGVDAIRTADEALRHAAAAEHLFALRLPREVDRGLHHVLRLLRAEECRYHDSTRADEEERGGARGCVEGTHHMLRRARAARDEVLVGREGSQGDTHEVDQVVARKRQRQGEGAEEDDDFEHIDSEPIEQLHEQRAADEDTEHEQRGVVGYPLVRLGGHVGALRHGLDEHEIEDGSDAESAEEPDEPFQARGVVEGEKEPGEPLDDGADDEGDTHREEDAEDDLQGFLGVEQVGERQRGVVGDLDTREAERAAEQLEDQRDGGAGGHAQRVEHIEEDDIGEHDRHEDTHDFLKGEMLGAEDTVAGDVHHAVADGGADEDTDSRHEDDTPQGRYTATHRRV